jgi:CBS domain-containing protein
VLIEHILHRKGHEVETIPADAPVADAVARLRERNIGALVVTGSASGGDSAGASDDDSTGDGGSETSGGGSGGGAAAGPIAGILSERDIVRALAAATPDAAVLDQPVSALMSTDLSTCSPQSTVDELMRLMTDRRIRHVPVLDGGELAGIVSIGDVVKSRIDELQTEAETLHDYISSGR